MPESYMAKFLKTQPRVFMTDSVRFRRTVEEVKEMGFDPLKMKFVEAVYAMSGMSKSTWERKVNAYKRWGLSEAEILVAFKKHPLLRVDPSIWVHTCILIVNECGFL